MLNGKYNDRAIANAAIEQRALTLRSRGLDYEEIAEQMRISRPMAAKAVRRGFARYRQECKEAVDQILHLEMHRLDMLFVSAFQLAAAGNMEATQTCLKIMERRAKFLGLDAAQKQQVQTIPHDSVSHLSMEKLEEIEKLLEANENPDSAIEEIAEDIDYGIAG